jgi:hypothetical protein
VAFDFIDLLLQEYLVDVLNYKAGNQRQHWNIDNTHNLPSTKKQTVTADLIQAIAYSRLSNYSHQW